MLQLGDRGLAHAETLSELGLAEARMSASRAQERCRVLHVAIITYKLYSWHLDSAQHGYEDGQRLPH